MSFGVMTDADFDVRVAAAMFENCSKTSRLNDSSAFRGPTR
jgi:hypothetical protein